MAVFTHDQISITTGVMSKAGIVFGGNALQSITINRNTPKDPVQAMGHLGIVDYTSGNLTSDLTLDCILIEDTVKADVAGKTNSVYKYANENVVVGTESYVMTSFSSSWTAGTPATISIGFLTGTSASSIASQLQPDVETGEESSYAVVVGDDGSGVQLVPTWDGGTPPSAAQSNIPILNSAGALVQITDNGLPAGVQTINCNATINRDNVLDVRTVQPVQFVTTYPLDLTCDMDVFEAPSSFTVGAADYKPQWDKLLDLDIQATALGKHPSPSGATPAGSGLSYLKMFGFTKVTETDTVSVGQFLTFSVNFLVADVICPLTAP